jgi:hypothetical protein
VLLLAAAAVLHAARFYADDPLAAEPPPLPVKDALARKLNDQFDFFFNTFAQPGERHAPGKPVRARGVNTLGEPMRSAWYTPRHYWKRMSLAELLQGPDGSVPESRQRWTVIRAKAEGITPGFTVIDAKKQRYFVKFDPPGYPELASSADVISSKFFHALGYNVPYNEVVFFDPEILEIAEDVKFVDKHGRNRQMQQADLDDILARAPKGKEGKVRALVSLAVSGSPLGPFRYHGTRSDDPNDVVAHEHRRDLRGLSVFAAWLGHDDSRAINTLDVLAEDGGTRYLKHYLIDFGSTLGSASSGPNSPRSGGEYLFAWEQVTKRALTLGLVVPFWARAQWPEQRSAGRFESRIFNAATWVPEYPNPAFENRLPDDDFWAAKQVMAFTDEEIRALVTTGRYTDPAAAAYVTDTLIARRDKIGRAFLNRVLPLDRFEVSGDRLVFEDVAARHGMGGAGSLSVTWSRFDNESERKTRIEGSGFELPPALHKAPTDAIFAADISTAEDTGKAVTVYVRKVSEGFRVIGIDRSW